MLAGKNYEVISGPTKEICNATPTSFKEDSNLAKCKEKCDNDQNCYFLSISDEDDKLFNTRGVVCKTYYKCTTLKTAVRSQTIYKKLGL